MAVPNFFSPLVTLTRFSKRTETFFILLTQLHQISSHGGSIKFGHEATIKMASLAMEENPEKSFFECLPLGGPKRVKGFGQLVTFPLRSSEFQLLIALLQACVSMVRFPSCNKRHRVVYIRQQSDALLSVCRTASDTFPHYRQTCGADMNH